MDESLGSGASWGPALCWMGVLGLVMAFWVHVMARKPTVWTSTGPSSGPPCVWERASVHLIFYSAWSLGFGLVVWRGAAASGIDTRLSFERSWPVYAEWEWIYLSVYGVPLLMPWLAPDRAALRDYALTFSRIVAISLALYVALPFYAPPRPFIPDSLAGKVLAWETRRQDFAAAALPSFHVFWALLCARLLSKRGPCWAFASWGWAVAASVSCVANGAHAVLDVVASLAIYAVVAGVRSRAVAHGTTGAAVANGARLPRRAAR